MNLPFSKMHGAGNDFIVIDGFQHSWQPTPEEVIAMCDRHCGIGADGVIIVRPSPEADGFMDYHNADGSLAQMCGNGVRVSAKFLVDNGYAADFKTITVDTRAGIKNVSITRGADGLMSTARVAMGAPILEPESIPVRADSTLPAGVATAGLATLNLATPWGEVIVHAVSMANPHAVIFLDKEAFSALEIEGIGAYLESHEAFPENTNVEFASVSNTADGDVIDMRVYERGVGETLACGTGACATLVAAAMTERSAFSAQLNLLGGQLHIEWSPEGEVFKTGPATTVFSGIWPLD